MNAISHQYSRFLAAVGARQYAPQKKFLRQAVGGILSRRSVLLSEIGRALKEPFDLIQTEKRLSRNLGSKRFDDYAIEQDYLQAVAPFLRDPEHRVPTIAVDLTDIHKTRARVMPNLAKVRDGSTGDIVNGYEIVSIEAVGDNGRRLPLCSRLFSHVEDVFKSEHDVVANAIRHVQPYVPREAVWVFDRGFEGRHYLQTFKDCGLRFAVRLTVPEHDEARGHQQRQRNLYIDGVKHRIRDAVESVAMRHEFRCRKFSAKAKRSWRLQVGWISEVQLQGYTPSGWASGPGAEVYSLVVVRGTGKEPLVVLTNVAVRNAQDAQQVADSYMERWGVEEAHRLTKQAFDLEDMRALTWTGLRRLVLLAMLAYGFLAVLVHGSRDQVENIARSFRAFGPVPVYMFYRLLEGIGRLIGPTFRGGP